MAGLSEQMTKGNPPLAPELLERMGFVGRHSARESIADRTDLDADAPLGQQLQQAGSLLAAVPWKILAPLRVLSGKGKAVPMRSLNFVVPC